VTTIDRPIDPTVHSIIVRLRGVRGRLPTLPQRVELDAIMAEIARLHSERSDAAE
jgi:hypothetical protein